MHICFLNMPIEFYSPVSGGAISTIIMQTARALEIDGHRVTVLTIKNKDEVYSVGDPVYIETKWRDDLSFGQRRISGLRGKLAGWDWPYFEYYRNSYLKALKAMVPAPDAVVVFNDLVSARYIKQVCPQTRVLVWLQNECRTRQKNLTPSVESTFKFLTCSSYIRTWTAQNHGIALDKIEVAPSGIDLQAFFPRPDYLTQTSALRVFFVGRIDPNKGPDIAADAVAALQAQGLPVTLTVAGSLWFYDVGNEMENPYFRALNQKMDAVGADYRGHVTHPQLPALIRQHDVACVLSRANEPFGLVALEAMASGLAVIASDRGGLPEACGGAALLVNPDDLASVVSNLNQLATDPQSLREQKQKSVARAARSPWSETAKVVERVLKEQK
jgi:glycosyltransferase involved in cell wall biosynthesis